MRAPSRDDIQSLGRLYFESYERGKGAASIEAAVTDVEASFAGGYGELWPQASPVVVHDGGLVAAVMAVRRAPWEDTPNCPFIVEVFVAAGHRRRGLARMGLRRSFEVIAEADEEAVSLRVDEDNTAARELYRSLGFIRWD
ncbi:MAG: GNAT family N-acetyltransferase [Acidimicrobiia bacterium]